MEGEGRKRGRGQEREHGWSLIPLSIGRCRTCFFAPSFRKIPSSPVHAITMGNTTDGNSRGEAVGPTPDRADHTRPRTSKSFKLPIRAASAKADAGADIRRNIG